MTASSSIHPQSHIIFYHIQRTNGYLCRFSPNARIARLYIGSPRNQINNGYTDLMVDGAPSPHQSDTTLRWLIDR
ncbi:hypothetical protein M5P25_02435, partial [Neisseria perflava]|uniref:hypothetical protein n=1 Tax=Neisseria perflava TaxID=33053 RepID=UPI00201A57A2